MRALAMAAALAVVLAAPAKIHAAALRPIVWIGGGAGAVEGGGCDKSDAAAPACAVGAEGFVGRVGGGIEFVPDGSRVAFEAAARLSVVPGAGTPDEGFGLGVSPVVTMRLMPAFLVFDVGLGAAFLYARDERGTLSSIDAPVLRFGAGGGFLDAWRALIVMEVSGEALGSAPYDSPIAGFIGIEIGLRL